MADRPGEARLPLFPLPNVVHFPNTQLKLHVFEPRYRQLLRDLERQESDERLVGMVLMKPGWSRKGTSPDVFPRGTAGRLIHVDPLPDGRSDIILEGVFRFEIRREIEPQPYRRAVVRPVDEQPVDEDDPEVESIRHDLLDLVRSLRFEIGESFPIEPSELITAPAPLPFADLVNRIAAEIDLPILGKLGLLNEVLPERADRLLKILRSRQQLMATLRPYRHLASNGDQN